MSCKTLRWLLSFKRFKQLFHDDVDDDDNKDHDNHDVDDDNDDNDIDGDSDAT